MSDEETDYVPIACGLYSRYELAILRRQRLRVRWKDPEGADHIESLLPLDLYTERKEEFMTARAPDGRVLQLRLDRIVSAEPLDDAGP